MLTNLTLRENLFWTFVIVAFLFALTGIAGVRTINKVGTEVDLIIKAGIAREKQAQARELPRQGAQPDLATAATLDPGAGTAARSMMIADTETAKIRHEATSTFLSVTVLSFAMAMLLGVLVTRSITKRMGVIAKALQKAAAGDLSARVAVDSGDALGRLAAAYNAMADRWSDMMTRANAALLKLARVGGRITSASQQVVAAAETLAGGISQTSSALMDISATHNKVGTNMESLALLASESSASTLQLASNIEEVALDMETLNTAVEEVSSSILQMAASIRHIGEATDVLLGQSTSTACSIDQMNCSIKEVERNAMETAAISEAVRKDAQLGQRAVEDTIAGINEIRLASSVTTEIIGSLSSRAKDIGSILSVINSVIEQTNLLALNAAIIAAQAGEHGTGFAVVADEIKELAEQTSDSTREIAMLIKAVQEESHRAVTAINNAERSIAEGEQLSHKAGAALAEIVNGVERTSLQMGSIARATQEQTKGSQIIREAMDRIAEMVSRIAVATREQTSANDLIAGAAERMKGLTSEVRVSTQEQSKIGLYIACSIENVTDRLHGIKHASEEQSRGSGQIVESVGEIQQTAGVALQTSRVMEGAVGSLAHQMVQLQAEMGRFKMTASGGGTSKECSADSVSPSAG